MLILMLLIKGYILQLKKKHCRVHIFINSLGSNNEKVYRSKLSLDCPFLSFQRPITQPLSADIYWLGSELYGKGPTWSLRPARRRLLLRFLLHSSPALLYAGYSANGKHKRHSQRK